MLVIGSRGSKLALWQAHWVEERLKEMGVASRIEIIRTTGDKITDVPLARVGTKGLFTKEIEEALQEGRIDLAVHSLKDLPTELPPGLQLAAIPLREDARDALVLRPEEPLPHGRGSATLPNRARQQAEGLVDRTLADLPRGANVGTSSLRRAAQLRALRPDLEVEPVRGNLDTRLRKLDDGRYQALVLAAAGLTRLGWQERISEYLPVEVMCPAVGQGALAVETRADEGEAARVCARLDDAATRAAVTAERATLAALGGGCQVPIGAHAQLEAGRLRLRAVVVSPDGRTLVREEIRGDSASALELGRELGRRLLDGGAAEILEEVYGGPAR